MRNDEGHQQPTGRAQSPLSSAFPIIILLDNCLSSTLKVLVDGHGAQNGSLGELPGFAVRYSSSANSLHGLEDWLQANHEYLMLTGNTGQCGTGVCSR